MTADTSSIRILPTGAANIASVIAALARQSAAASLVRSASDIDGAEGLILPGVGSFGHAMHTLRDAGWIEPLRERLTALRPTLCICLGHQLLSASSDESPGAIGLGIHPGHVERFDAAERAGLRVPHLGWNTVEADPSANCLEGGAAYFANSYRLLAAPAGWQAAHADYGGRFVAGLERGGVVTCQFHPELSGLYGTRLLRRWLAMVEGGVRC
ncbi:MAG: imidazole glycerol phosphate synthase subunit HisH [Planctomycetota bacterium]